MPSKNTSILSARVKDETLLKLTQEADNRNISVAKLLDDIARDLGYEEKGVTPDKMGVFEYEDLGFDKVLNAYRELQYSDNAIRQTNEQFRESIMEAGRYNTRRSNEWGA